MMWVDVAYQDLLRQLLKFGVEVETRNSKVKRLMNWTVTFAKTPLISLRKTAWKSALREWEWFMSGSEDIEDLHPSVRHWWEPFARGGIVKNNYGAQFCHFGTYPGFDQVAYLIESVKEHPFSRRSVITTWNTQEMADKETPITNCHGSLIQCFVNPDNTLDMTMYQRSCDAVVGVPHNWIQYWAFLMWLAHLTKRKVGHFTWIGGDVHLYEVHKELARKIIDTEGQKETPVLVYRAEGDKEFEAEDFVLSGEYVPTLHDKAEMVV